MKAIIQSMTKGERAKPSTIDPLNASAALPPAAERAWRTLTACFASMNRCRR